jgi:hypothetical protein
MAQFESIAPGSAKQAMKEQEDSTHWLEWYANSPGLRFKVQFLAWKHRAESPVLKVSIHSDSLDDVPDIRVVPKTEWSAGVIRDNSDTAMNARAHAHFGHQDFRADETHMVRIVVTFPGNSPKMGLGFSNKFHVMTALHSSVLTDLTADDFAAEMTRRRNDGDCSPTAYVRLTGLHGAAHLNGQEGVLRGRDPNGRMTIRLNGGREVGVLSKNYEKVHRPKLLRCEFGDFSDAPWCMRGSEAGSESESDDESDHQSESE